MADEGEDKESKSRNIYYMNIDGKNRIKVAENAQQPCWSPDGKYIAYPPGEYPRYDPNFSANKGIEIYNLETREVKRHPNDEIFHIRDLCWSPDGEWFVSKFTYRGNHAFKVDGSTVMGLSTMGCTPDISPDGEQLAWNGTDSSLNIGTLDVDSPQSNVTDHRIVVACEREYWVYGADWSPDGNYLTFSYFPEEGGDRPAMPAPWSNICVCDLSTGKWTQITTDGKYNMDPDWIPVKVR
jgi:Tol biopolymer transport system component